MALSLSILRGKGLRYMTGFFIFLLSFSSFSKPLWTISGISSGGFMAEQMAVAHSEHFSGVATIAGGYYYCAGTHFDKQKRLYGTSTLVNYRTNTPVFFKSLFRPFSAFFMNVEEWVTPAFANPLYRALTVCLNNPSLSRLPNRILGSMYFDIVDMAARGQIDPLENLTQQRVLIYQGQKDSVVNPAMAQQLKHFRTYFNSSSIEVIEAAQAAHNFPSSNVNGIGCDEQRPPYVGNCQFSMSQKIVDYLMPSVTQQRKGHIRVFTLNQTTQFTPPSIAPYGYLVANDWCLKSPERCEMHVALHGCQMSDYFDPEIQKNFEQNVLIKGVTHTPDNSKRAKGMWLRQFIELGGWKEAIQAKPIMIVFPQTQISEINYPFNPSGCWDWYGWTGPEYATKSGVETQWLFDFIKQVSKQPSGWILEDVTNWPLSVRVLDSN